MRTPTAVLVAVALVAAAVSGAGIAGAATGDALAADATPTASVDDTTAPASVDDTTALQSTAVATPENLSVRVKTPRTIAKNVTQNYSVAVDGADGNVTATWTFDREAANGTDGVTKNGTAVQHTWADGGNATITVTVVDESGASVTKELTVTVVEYGSADDDPAGSTPFRFVGSMIVMVLAMVLLPAVLYLFVLPTAMTYLTDEFS
ncbi:PKD domain-containing protein [Halorubellus litoreus]|uniref:PKD domain-containing protein n=1 Tax=Halorubellus litoreus TaxID=755308 RepID=A0ABD5VKE2_9EURY